jgi:prolyl-tRNA synthetase
LRYSKLLLPTLKETPAEAELISHQLMLRAGMIRKLAAGVYSYLPLGYRVIRKIENIIREEMNRAGAQELLLPVLNPAELWQESGRWEVYGPELIRLTDRHQRNFCLGPTHEEIITDLVRREVRSYRELPLNLYQIQTKFRDEIRPRFGLMRGREFIMKDAYSFDRDDTSAEESYRQMHEAYNRIFKRCGLNFRVVEADSGPIGGKFSHEFMVIAESGEDLIVSCQNGDYAANIERAWGLLANQKHIESPKLNNLQKIATPGLRTVEEVAGFLGRTPKDLLKTMVIQADQEILLALIRGDHELNLTKLKNHLGVDQLALATPEIIIRVTSAPVGFAGPLGIKGYRIIADLATKDMFNFITGANEEDQHHINVNWNRDVTPTEYADIRLASAGDLCPRCKAPLDLTRGIEVGHIFKLGTKYSESLRATYLDEQSREQFCIMGCYGIGVGRTMAAAIEQNHDRNGIIWPKALAPYQVLISPLDMEDEQVTKLADDIYRGLKQAGLECLLDDRDVRPGIKFKDADLIGIPLRLTIGTRDLKANVLELRVRKTGQATKLPPEEALSSIQQALKQLD